MKASILQRIFLLMVFLGIMPFVKSAPAQQAVNSEMYLIGSGNSLRDSSLTRSSFGGYVVYNLNGVFIVQYAPLDSIAFLNDFTQTCALQPAPLDSLMALYFNSTRALRQGAFLLQLRDTCRIQAVHPFVFQIKPSPLKEINIFTLKNLPQDEFYFDLDLKKVNAAEQMSQYLFFEFLWQWFLNQKILANKIYTESVLSALAAAYRPVYEPELHFYLEARAADEVVRKWEKIKQAFLHHCSRQRLQSEYVLFREQLKLITETSHSKMILWAKLMSRYGYHKNLRRLCASPDGFLDRFEKNLAGFVNGMQLIWFRSSEIDQDLIKALQAQDIKGGIRLFMQ